jgi:hypothetical protein
MAVRLSVVAWSMREPLSLSSCRCLLNEKGAQKNRL